MDNESVPRLCGLGRDVCCSLGQVTGGLLVGFWSVSGLESLVEGEGVAR